MDEYLLDDVVAAAMAAGADAAEAVFAERAALSVGVRLGALEEVEREESRDLGVRVFVGARQASVSGSDVSRDGRALHVHRNCPQQLMGALLVHGQSDGAPRG